MPSCLPVAVLIWFSSSIPRGWEPTDRSASRGTAGRVGVSIALKPRRGVWFFPTTRAARSSSLIAALQTAGNPTDKLIEGWLP
jgi:hypothetical protein